MSRFLSLHACKYFVNLELDFKNFYLELVILNVVEVFFYGFIFFFKFWDVFFDITDQLRMLYLHHINTLIELIELLFDNSGVGALVLHSYWR